MAITPNSSLFSCRGIVGAVIPVPSIWRGIQGGGVRARWSLGHEEVSVSILESGFPMEATRGDDTTEERSGRVPDLWPSLDLSGRDPHAQAGCRSRTGLI